MTKNDFLYILSDAIQFHEGWNDVSRSFKNLNPGNLRFVGQANATPDADNFCVFKSFYDGKTAQLNDLSLKLNNHNTIRDIISVYAPPMENDTEAYIASVISFFGYRNVQIIDTAPIDVFLQSVSKSTVLVVVNSLFIPSDWHSIQRSISQCAGYMPLYSFTVRYSNVDLSADIVSRPTIISQSTSVLSQVSTQDIIKEFNMGQIFNILIYDGSIMQGHPSPAGGCEYQTEISSPVMATASVLYNGSGFADSTARVLFHELIHEFCTVEQVPDTLHEYLIAHGGYNVDSTTDLLAYFSSPALNNLQGALNVAQEGIKESPPSWLSWFLAKVADLLKSK